MTLPRPLSHIGLSRVLFWNVPCSIVADIPSRSDRDGVDTGLAVNSVRGSFTRVAMPEMDYWLVICVTALSMERCISCLVWNSLVVDSDYVKVLASED